MRTHSFIALLAAGALLTACGGGSGSGRALPPSTPANSQQRNGTATFVVTIPPKRTTASLQRKPQYLTANVQGIEFSVWQKYAPPAAPGGTTLSPDAGYAFFPLSANSSYCSAPPLGGLVCTLPVPALAGNDTFVVNTYDQPGTFVGALVSTGSVTANIAANQNNTINIITSGIPTFFADAIDNAFPSSPITQQIHFMALDVDANVIVGPFDAPVQVSDSDASGATSLSATSLNSSADAGALMLNYTGGPVPGGTASITFTSTSQLAAYNTGLSYSDTLHFAPQNAGVISTPSFLQFVSPHDNSQSITLSGGTAAPYVADTNPDSYNDSGFTIGSNVVQTNFASGCQGIVTVSGSSPTYTVSPAGPGMCYLDIHDSASPANAGRVAIVVQSSQPLVGATPSPQFSVNPTQLSFTAAGQTGTFTVSESGYSGGFTPTSGNTNVATVSGAGTSFTVTAVSAGQSLITVKDGNGNIATATVTVTTTSVPTM